MIKINGKNLEICVFWGLRLLLVQPGNFPVLTGITITAIIQYSHRKSTWLWVNCG